MERGWLGFLGQNTITDPRVDISLPSAQEHAEVTRNLIMAKYLEVWKKKKERQVSFLNDGKIGGTEEKENSSENILLLIHNIQ